jgi:hypothetical protein
MTLARTLMKSCFESLNQIHRSADFQVGSAQADLEIGAPVYGEGECPDKLND